MSEYKMEHKMEHKMDSKTEQITEPKISTRFQSNRQFFRAYSYLLRNPSPVGENMRYMNTLALYTDPFTGTLWLGRAHQARDEGLRAWLQSLAPVQGIEPASDLPVFEIWLLPRAQESYARCLTVEVQTGTEPLWHPIDLDNTRGSLALEWLGLPHTRVLSIRDVRFEDLPEDIQNKLYRRHWQDIPIAEEDAEKTVALGGDKI